MRKLITRLFTIPSAKTRTRFVRFVRPSLAVLAVLATAPVIRKAAEEGQDLNAYQDPLIVWLAVFPAIYLLTALVRTVGTFVLNVARPDRAAPERHISPARVGVVGATVFVALAIAAIVVPFSGSSSPDDERFAANLQAQEWSSSRAPVFVAFNRAALKNDRFFKQMQSGNVAAASRLAAEIESDMGAARDDWLTLPKPELQDLQRVDAQYARSFALAAAAFADYAAGLRANAASGVPLSDDEGVLALLSSGDAKWDRARTTMTNLGERLLELNAKYGGERPDA